MRVWFIDPAYLDNQRLVAAHQEIEACRTCLIKGIHWGNATRFFEDKFLTLQREHNIIVDEMCIRNGKDSSLHIKFTIPRESYSQSLVEFTVKQKSRDVIHLREKWEREMYYFGIGRYSLRHLERNLKLKIGRPDEECRQLQQDSRKLVKDNQLWFKEYRINNPKSRMQDRMAAFKEQQ